MDSAAEKPRRSHAPVVARYQAKRLAEGKCRRCGTRPRMSLAGGRMSPYCEDCRAKASARQAKRLTELRQQGQPAPSPGSPAWKVHLAAPDGGALAPCGAKADVNAASDIAAVTCGNCARTAAFRAAAADERRRVAADALDAASNAYDADPSPDNRDALDASLDDWDAAYAAQKAT